MNLLETSDCHRRLCGIRVAFVSFSWRSRGVRVACSEAAWRSHGPPFFPVTCPLRSRGVPVAFPRGFCGERVATAETTFLGVSCVFIADNPRFLSDSAHAPC